jgi:hypothetical protein
MGERGWVTRQGRKSSASQKHDALTSNAGETMREVEEARVWGVEGGMAVGHEKGRRGSKLAVAIVGKRAGMDMITGGMVISRFACRVGDTGRSRAKPEEEKWDRGQERETRTGEGFEVGISGQAETAGGLIERRDEPSRSLERGYSRFASNGNASPFAVEDYPGAQVPTQPTRLPPMKKKQKRQVHSVVSVRTSPSIIEAGAAWNKQIHL